MIYILYSRDINMFVYSLEARGSVVVEVLCYKAEGRGFETPIRRINFFNLPNPCGRTRPLGLLGL
jgi:hypothetical protein